MADHATPEATPLEVEMRGLVDKYIAPQVTRAQQLADDIAERQRELLSHMERDTSPADAKVQDLEAEKADREAELAAMREEIRKVRLELKAEHAAGDARSDWRGVVFRNIKAIQDAVRNHGGFYEAMNSRAIDTSDIATAGKLGPDLESQFITWLIGKQAALSRVQVRRMTSPTARLDEMIVGTRKLRAGSEATDATPADGVSFAKRDLATVEVVWPEDLSRSFLEDNIEGPSAEQTISQAIATAFGNDSNDLFWNGDEDNSDAFLGINDGIIDIAKADGSVVDYDATSVATVQAILAGALRALPVDYAALPLAAFLPYKTVLSYADEIADRKTVMGDQALVQGVSQATYFGIPVIGDAHLNLGSQDEGVLTPLGNLVWGVQRGITLETEWRPRKRAVEVTVSARTDQNYVKSGAVVLIDGIDAALR